MDSVEISNDSAYESEKARDIFYLIKMHHPSIYDNYFIYKIPRLGIFFNDAKTKLNT